MVHLLMFVPAIALGSDMGTGAILGRARSLLQWPGARNPYFERHSGPALAVGW